MNNAVITVENLSKRYRNAKTPAVDNISFSVGEGEFFAFLGQNGAGKTTTISILTTTLAKTAGSVTIAGYDIDREAREIRSRVGIIFQRPSIDLDLSAEENIRFHACMYGLYAYRPFFSWMPKTYRERVTELAEIMGIAGELRKPLKTFSGGMQRKIEIIRSLIHRPAVLFLDEPTQGLDPVSRRGLWNYINTVRKEDGTTIFLTTHYIDEAENVDKLCMIQQGKIVFSGAPAELKTASQSESLEDAYIGLLTEDPRGGAGTGRR
jgi:ABC-2 type transport system ATP-binding protein